MGNLLEKKWLRASLLISSTCVILGFASAGMTESPWLDALIKQLILGYLGVIVVRAVFFFTGTAIQRYESYRLSLSPDHTFRHPLVSIIVPCYNESEVIAYSLKSLFELDYPNVEIIVVDDGSKDSTAQIAQTQAQFSSRFPVTVVSQKNSGKAHALNHGLTHARGELILCVDADSRLNPDSLGPAVRHFDDPTVGAVAGFVEIVNQKNILLMLQQLEYLVGLNFVRRAMSHLGVVPIVPGPAGLFRRKALFEIGAFEPSRNLYAEDAELSMRLLSRGWKIRTEENLIAFTEAPETYHNLLRQRYRWNRGTYQALLMNFNSLIRSGWRGRWIANHLFIEGIITPVLNMGLILYFLTYYFRTGQMEMFTKWYFYLLGMDLLSTGIAVHRQKNILAWLMLSLFNKVHYFYMLLTWRILSLYEEWLGLGMSWDKLDRTATELKESS